MDGRYYIIVAIERGACVVNVCVWSKFDSLDSSYLLSCTRETKRVSYHTPVFSYTKHTARYKFRLSANDCWYRRDLLRQPPLAESVA